MASQREIAQQVVASIPAQKPKPDARLGEQALANRVGVNRTLVREALKQLQARGFVEARIRQGGYVVGPSIEAARDAYAARRAVEAGMLREAMLTREAGTPLQPVIVWLGQHVKDEQAAVANADVATRTLRLADVHVCLTECLGHRVLCGVLLGPTARASLVASLSRSRPGIPEQAAQLMLVHIGDAESALSQSAGSIDLAERLRAALAPLASRAGRIMRCAGDAGSMAPVPLLRRPRRGSRRRAATAPAAHAAGQ